MHDLLLWHEVSRGLYRYTTLSNNCYEISIIQHALNSPIEDAIANLYVTGITISGNRRYFTRELVLECKSVKDCITEVKKRDVHMSIISTY